MDQKWFRGPCRGGDGASAGTKHEIEPNYGGGGEEGRLGRKSAKGRNGGGCVRDGEKGGGYKRAGQENVELNGGLRLYRKSDERERDRK